MHAHSEDFGPDSLPGPAAEAAQAEREGYLLTAALSQRVDLIRHLIDFSRQIVLIMGDEGSGKTSLLHHLHASAAENWRVAKVNADPMCDAEALVKRLGAEFDLNFTEGDDIERRVAGFNIFLATARRALLVPVVLVDDAHLLPADALLLLLRLAQPESEAPHLRVALFCDSRMARLLGSPQLHAFKDSLVHTLEMAPFTLEDTARYLATHWAAVDPESDPILDDGYVREVHAASEGIPGRIKALVRTSLAESAIESTAAAEPAGGRHLPLGWAAAGGAVALLLAVGIWLSQRANQSGPAPGAGAPIVETVPVPIATEAPGVSPTAALPPANAPTGPVPPIVDYPLLPEAAPSSPAPTAAASVPPEPEAPPPATAAQAAPGRDSAQATAPQPPAVAAAPPARREPEPTPAKPERKPRAATGAGVQWLRQQPQGNYVVQLYATYQRSSAEQFIAEHKLGARANVIATVRDGKTWHVVVYGSYADRTRARNAIGGLPDGVRRLSPWVRKIADLRAIAVD
ncbi:MAG: SPOR domain-containing protein [Gammaproteobacteria bacterium]|nr:SPOR domain-containing protein [Gammaproteobacteria bacterium]